MTTSHETSSEVQEMAVDMVLAEREYQDEKWGGSGFDDTQTQGDWASYIIEYATGNGHAANYSFAKRMMKVAALGLAALEAEIRRGNHP